MTQLSDKDHKAQISGQQQIDLRIQQMELDDQETKKAEWEYVPNAKTRAAIEECESGKDLETLDMANFKAYVKSL